jgi:hypothetical protein
VGFSGLAVEVGPQAHGTINVDLLEGTQRLVQVVLDYIEAHNKRILAAAGTDIEQKMIQHGRHELFSVDDLGEAVALPDAANPDAEITVPFHVTRTTLPAPCDEEGRQTAVLHRDAQKYNWQLLKAGTPIFQSLETGEELLFEPPAVATGFFHKQVSEFYPIFIGEASYVISNMALALTSKEEKAVY